MLPQYESTTNQINLSNNCISCIFQDSRGFIWIGTESGLNKYDGYSITDYLNDPENPHSISHNFIRTIFEDAADSGKVLWIGTKGGGLNKYDRETDQFTAYQQNPDVPTSLSHNEVKCIYKDSDGIYWIGTEGGGLNKFDKENGKFISYNYDPNDSNSISHNSVFSMCEDHQGYLWIATSGGGLDKFDRKTEQFKHYYYNPDDPNGLPSNVIFAIHEDREQVLWIGTKFGLRKYDRESDRITSHRFKNTSSHILNHTITWAIYEDNKGSLWIATIGNGLFNIDPKRDEVFHYENVVGDPASLSRDQISTVCQDHSGIIWVGTYCYGITKLVPIYRKFEHYQNIPGDPTSLSNNLVSSFYEDPPGTIWITTLGGGLNKFDRVTQKFTRFQFDSYQDFSSICGNKLGELWIARTVSLTQFNPSSGKYTDYSKKFKGYHPKAIKFLQNLFDQNLALSSIQHVGDAENITQEFEIHKTTPVLIVALGEAITKKLVDTGWLEGDKKNELMWKMEFEKTEHAGGAFRNRIQLSIMTLSPGKYRLHYVSNVIHSYHQWIDSAPDMQNLWGISIIPVSQPDIEKLKPLLEMEYYTSYVGLEGGEVSYVYQDRSNVTWCIIFGCGLYQFDRERKEFVPYEIFTNELIFTEICLVFEDRSGTHWFGTTGKGLIKRVPVANYVDNTENCRFIQYKRNNDNSNSISSNTINSIAEDKEGNLWISTDLGLNKFDPGTESFIHYRKKDGLPSDIIYGVLEDDRGYLWLNTNNGLSKFNPKTEIFKNYKWMYGSNAFFKSQDGEIFGGGFKGFGAFYPDSIRENHNIPAIAITNFQLFNKSVAPGDNSPLKKTISETREILLSHDQEVISFEFAALDFTDSKENKYAYKMEGVDRDWVYTNASRRFATYTKLDPGKYIFKVKGTNNDGVWNEEGVSVRIIITPPWWRTNWAYAGYLLLVIGAVAATWRLQMRRIRVHNELKMKKFEAQKLQEVDHLKSRFFANISHEFRTPLTLILGPINTLLAKFSDKELHQELTIMQRNAKRLHRLINQLLELSKIEAGNMKLQAQPTNIVALLNRIIQSFESQAKLKNIELKFAATEPRIDLYVDREKIENIFYNLLSNALKFTPKGGQVSINISHSMGEQSFMPTNPSVPPLVRGGIKGGVKITVSNTDSFIPPDRIDKIFERFYQVDDSYTREHEGSGIGLSLTKELVTQHHGEIQVQSSGTGLDALTTFTVMLPTGKDHLQEDEIIGDVSLATKHSSEDSITKIKALDENASPFQTSELQSEKSYKITPISPITKSFPSPVSGFLSPVSGMRSPLILIVEDNADLRTYMRSNLQHDYCIYEAQDGAEGLKNALDKIPDLIISDVMMPVMDGFKLCQKLKTDERTSHIPVILLTARAEAMDKISGLETGADDYLTKPFDTKELQVRIKNLIEQRRKLREKFNRDIFLQPKEFACSSYDERFLQRAMEIIEQHLEDPDFKIATSTKEIGMSRKQLYRKIHALTNQSANRFIRSLRLKRAADLLQKKYGNVAEVSYKVGFNNPSYFAECFRKQFGTLPSEYSKS